VTLTNRLGEVIREWDARFEGTEPGFLDSEENRREYLSAVRELIHPELEFVSALTDAEGGRAYRGHEGLVEWARDIYGSFGVLRREAAAEIEAVGETTTVHRQRVHAVGRGSEMPLDLDVWVLWEFRDGLLWRSRTYRHREEALAEAQNT
jgi:hypothetical protein